MPASECFDDVMSEICPGADQEIDVAPREERSLTIPPMPAGTIAPARPKNFTVFIGQHPFVNVSSPGKRTTIICPNPCRLAHQLVDAHPGSDGYLLDRIPAFHDKILGF